MAADVQYELASVNQWPLLLAKERGSAPPTPPSGQQYIWVDHLDGRLKAINSAGAVRAIEFSDNALIPLQTITAPDSLSSSFGFSAIPPTYSGLRLVAQINAAGTIPVNAASLAIQFNGDTGLHYDSQFLYHNGGTDTEASADGGESSGRVGAADKNTAVLSSGASPLVIDIPNYGSSVLRKQWISDSATKGADTAPTFLFVLGGEWRSIAPITSVSLVHLFGTFAVGSVFSLYAIA